MSRITMRVILVSFVTVLCADRALAQNEIGTRQNYGQTIAADVSQQQSGGGASGQNLLIDHGGPVLGSSKTYAIYWGASSDFPADLQNAMASLLAGLNGSTYLGIAQQYMRTTSGISTTYMGPKYDPSAPPAKAPKTSDIGDEVCKLFPHPDPNGIYIVFTSNAPKINYCAWHAPATCNGVTFQVAYVPNQALLPACSPYIKTKLNCNSYSTGTATSADSVAHEFMEAVTDPHINAWYDKRGMEMADKCNFVYNSCVNLSGGSWQIQAEWSNAIHACQQQ